MSPFELRLLPIAELKPAPYHPRREPSKAAYRRLKDSLSEFGLVEPLIWNETTGHVVGGRLRLRILKELGATEAPVSVVRLTAAREKALNVLLNNPAAQARYDPAKLADLLAELEPLPESELTGFDRRAMPALRLNPVGAPPTDPPGPPRVEVTLVAGADIYEKLALTLDRLIGEHDLVAHVRRSA